MELNPLDDLGDAVFVVDVSSFFLRLHHQVEGHGQPDLVAEASFCAFRAVPDGSECVLDQL